MEQDNFLLKVIFSEIDIRKLKLLQKPASLEELIEQIKIKLNVYFNFCIQYEDRDFKSYLNVNSIDDVESYGTVKLLRLSGQEYPKKDEPSSASTQKAWPKVFPLPEFDIEVQSSVQSMSANVSPAIKKKIVSAMATEIAKFTLYPTHQDIRNMCITLTDTYPKLKNECPGGFDNWVISLKFKMGNLRKRLKDLPEVNTNTGRKSIDQPDATPPHTNIKKPRRGIVSRDLTLPTGETETSLQSLQKEMKEEMFKSRPSQKVLSDGMAKTWSIRRRFINEEASVKSIMKEWPAYNNIEQVYADFRRLTHVDLLSTFLAKLDNYAHSDDSESQDAKRNNLLRRLQALLKSEILEKFEADAEEDDVLSVTKPMYIAEVVLDERPSDYIYYIVIENFIVSECKQLYSAFMAFMAYIWVFNLQYPSSDKDMLEMIQKVLLDIDSATIPARIQTALKKL